MKKTKLTFSALMLFTTALCFRPLSANAFVTTDVLEAAGRVVATVGDVLRMGGINLEKGENKSTADKTGEGTKETDSYIEKINESITKKSNASTTSGKNLWVGSITGWATDFAKNRLKSGNPDKQKIRDNALRIAEVEAEILELELRLTLVGAEKTLYINTVEKTYQEKLAAYNANKQKLLAQTQELNILASVEKKIAEYTAKLQAKIDATLADKLTDVNAKIASAAADYEKAKKVVEEANEGQKKILAAELGLATAEYNAVENELKELNKELEVAKGLHQDTVELEQKIKEKTENYNALKAKVETEIPAKQQKAEENALADINKALVGFETAKENFLASYAQAQVEAELTKAEEIAAFRASLLGYDVNNSEDKKGKIEDKMAELQQQIEAAEANGDDTSAMIAELNALEKQYNSIQNIDVGSLLDGSFARDTASDVLSGMEGAIANELTGLLDMKASYEESFQLRTKHILNQIKTLKELREQLKQELTQQTIKFAIKGLLGVDLTNPTASLTQAVQLNYLDKDKPETAENIDEIRRNRYIERRDAYLSTYADAVMLKYRIGNDIDVVEFFANNTDSMDTVSGVIGADTDIKIKTIEALMQYAEILVAELRMDTATEFANLNTYKVKNPDKDITNFNLDDYLYDCSVK